MTDGVQGSPHASGGTDPDVLRLASIDIAAARELLARHGLALACVEDATPIPGSYWGESEAGVIGNVVHARADTPVHSLLHEACHLIVAPRGKRRAASIPTRPIRRPRKTLPAICRSCSPMALPGVGRERLCIDMDRWGYTFRLGSARAWFEHDAEDARAWLAERGLLAQI